MTHLNQSKLKQFAENIIKVAQMEKFVPDRVENSVGKGENAGYNSSFLECFPKA